MILLGIADAAHIYRLPESTIRRWISSGAISTHGKPRERRVDLAEIDAQVARRARRADHCGSG